MSMTPNWVRRNHFTAWSGYFCALVAFATLAMTLTAAGSGHTGYAMIAGVLFALTLAYGLTLISTTVHRDHVDHHATPNLLADKWDQTPRALRRRAMMTPVRSRQAQIRP
ncbi:hypothetical protein NRB20_02980 [Nocardia sp. RB20]|uniref:Uncharacterized protein n=2 Tax=Nocardia macrotermitis TaxID=2585198 RepID=A0A7K0CUT9_9NOCA|nr:hypothetical protein [Nocardia macrotermitis]